MTGWPSGTYRIWSQSYQKQPRGEPHLDGPFVNMTNTVLDELIAAQTASRI